MKTLIHTLSVEDDFDMDAYTDAVMELSAELCGCQGTFPSACLLSVESCIVHTHADDEWVETNEVVTKL